MKNKLSKRIFALFLAVLMLATSVPFAAFAKTTVWTQVASSDFTQTSWGDKTTKREGNGISGYATRSYYNNASYSPSLKSDDKTMKWSIENWNEGQSSTYDASAGVNGTYVDNGFIFLSGYSDSDKKATPITGAKNFKIDLAFRFDNANSSVDKTDKWCIMKLATTNQYSVSKEEMWKNTFFAQDAYGRCHVNGTGYVVPSNANKAIAMNNSNLSAYTDYHYVMQYDNGFIETYITDASGDILFYINAEKAGSLDTSNILGIVFGTDDNSEFMKGINYRSVTFYTNDIANDTADKSVPSSKNKYLMAYFTGNSAEGESLHMAVSDDGFNFEALNGNKPIWDSSKLGTVNSYPDNSGIAASGHVRDPYVFQAQDGSYYILATDLNTQNGTNWGNNTKLMVWHLDNLADLDSTDPWFIDTQSIAGSLVGGNVARAWAPEAIYDPEVGHYMLFWAIGYIGGHTRMYYMYTDDFKTMLTEPKQLLDVDYDNIDGNITYDGAHYYLWYKDENSKTVGYSVADHASGPYSHFTAFSDSNYTKAFEGPEVYQIQSTGKYVLMADLYGSPISYFATFQSSNPCDFAHNAVATNMNYLEPRHGSVVNITTAEYNALVDKYGKVTYDASAVPENGSANDYLVARYFTNDSAANDATGHGYNLTALNDIKMSPNFNGKVAAQFTSNGNNSSNYANSSWGEVNTSQMSSDYNFNIKDGLTFSWYGYPTSENISRFFDWSATEKGEIVWDGSGQNQYNSSYIYSTSDSEFGAVHNAYVEGCLGTKTGSYLNSWHLYTYTISENYLVYSVDGSVVFTQYAQNGESITKQASPFFDNCANSALMEKISQGTFRFGVSSWGADPMFNGYISDFRIYSKALTINDVLASIDETKNTLNVPEINGEAKSFYDPMEDTSIDGVDYTAYGDKTIDDNLHKKVLDVTYNGVSHYTYPGSTTDKSKGYTISMFYNPGDEVDLGKTIFNIGRQNSVDANNVQHFELTEDGMCTFNYQVSGITSKFEFDAFGGGSLPLNTWTHIVINVIPNGNNNAFIYVFFDGNMVNKINSYTYDNAPVTEKDIKAGQSMLDYFAVDRRVYYGLSCGDNDNAVGGKLDDFTIYNGVFDAHSIFVQDCKSIADSLYHLGLDTYKAAMAELGKENADYVYTNMSAAYNAYDAMERYHDSYTYGNTVIDPEVIVELYDNLVQATNNMTAYKKPATLNGYAESNKTAIAEKYTHNVISNLSGVVFNVDEPTTYVGDEYAKNRISSSDFVWLYTGMEGDTPIAPYSAGSYNKYKFATTFYQGAYFISNDVPMKLGGGGLSASDDEYWHQNTSKTDGGGVTANVNWYYEDYSNKFKTISGKDNNVYGVKQSDTTWYNSSIYARFTGTKDNFVASQATDSTYTASDGIIYNYLISFSPEFTAEMWANNSYYTNSRTINGTVRVINYQIVYNALTDAARREVLSKITEYTPESMKDLVEAYDALTNTSYMLGGVADAAALAKDIKVKVDNLEGVDITKVVPKADYSDAINVSESESVVRDEMVDNGTSDKYTTSSWNAYDNAVDAIRDHFTSLNPKADDMPYASDQGTVDRLKDNISASKNVLVEKADYAKIDEAMADNGLVELTHSTNNHNESGEQAYTYTSWDKFDDAYNEASYFSTADADYRNDTEKYAVNYTNNKYGPYIGYNKDGSIVTDLSITPYYYKFIGEFYENPDDEHPSQFETGDYVKIDGVATKLNGCRYYATDVSASDQSQRQKDIISTADDVKAKESALAVIGDYDNYNYSQKLAELADKDAYADNGTKIAENVATYGSSSAPASYNNKGGQPYITVDGVTYKDADQTQADAATTQVVTTLNTNKKTYTVTFNVYVDGTATTQTYNKTYGDVVKLNAVDVVPEVSDCTLAYTTLSNTDSNGSTVTSYINNNSFVLERRIQKDTVVDMYFVSKVDGAQLVKVQDYFGCPLDAGYVMQNETISVNKAVKTVTFTDAKGNTHNVTAKESAYYTFSYFEVAGAESADTVTVAGKDLIFTQRGIKSGNMTYTAIDGTVNGVTELADVKDNTQLEFVANDTTNFLVWVKTNVETPSVGDWHIASYQPTFKTFSADNGFVYLAVTNANWSTYLTQAQYDKVMEKLPFSFGTAAKLINDNGVTKFRMYCDFAYDKSLSNVVIVEAGAIYSATANDEATLYKGGANCRAVAANSINYDTNSYTITKTNAGTGTHYMRSYVSFTYTATVDGVETTIPRVVYGPVVKCENGSIVK